MEVALDHHHLGAVRYAPWVLGRWAAGAAGNRKIQRAPEEVHGADLAREPRTELSEYTVGGDELLPDGVGVRRVVLAAGVLLVEGDDHSSSIGTGQIDASIPRFASASSVSR